MKKIIVLCACMTTTLCTWAAWPDQKTQEHRLCTESEVNCSETISNALTGGGIWVKVSDSCGKCVMNNIDRKCGKPNCGGFMAGVDGTTKYEGGYIKSDYKCNKCGHTITYKNK